MDGLLKQLFLWTNFSIEFNRKISCEKQPFRFWNELQMRSTQMRWNKVTVQNVEVGYDSAHIVL